METTAPYPRATSTRRASRGFGALLWLAAVAIMLAAAVYQRATGPTHSLRGTVDVAGAGLDYELTRSGMSTEDAVVDFPDAGDDILATLVYRRYPTDEAYRRIPFERSDGGLRAPLPAQPAAGKLEYHVELEGAGAVVRVPSSPEEDPIIRFKDPVPMAVLLPHVLFMFLAILVGVRAGLGAAVGRRDARRYAWVALGLMTVGGMILGPMVQKHAFGAYWTGVPFGYDLTDNKMLLMWAVWLGACAVLAAERRRSRARGGEKVAAGGLRGQEAAATPGPGGRGVADPPGRTGQIAVVVATAVMLAVYVVPHSLRGSQLDYERLEEGVDPAEAIRAGQ